MLATEATGQIVCVGQGSERYRLWSLYDMLKFNAAHFTVVMSSQARLAALLSQSMINGWGNDPLIPATKGTISEELGYVRQALQYLPSHPLLDSTIDRLLQRASPEDNQTTTAQAEVLVKELHNDFVVHLQSFVFLGIDKEHREFWEQSAPPLGQLVAEQFPDAAKDIAASARCFALDEWTACVFHSMRVIEQGLHYLANLLQVEISGGIEYSNWGPVITQMQSKIAAMEQLTKGQAKSEQQEFYSGLAINFQYFQWGWRDPVSHSRGHYDPREADVVFRSAKDFMERLAKHKEANP